MQYGIGIDTGGTFTDAVIFDPGTGTVLSSGKSQTTHENLTVGILNALDKLDPKLTAQAGVISLSTTLATNACVEDKGALSKLLFIGVNPKAVAWVGAEAGLDHPELILYAPDEHWTSAEQWQDFLAEHSDFFADAQALGIVALNADKDQGVSEKAAREAILARFDFPVICGCELGNEINSIRRGASALLNGRLIRVLTDFLAAVRIALDQRQIKAPIAIMSSDGSLMSTSFTEEHPVETILCGPAASVSGAKAFTKTDRAVIVDMGGTTTDIALIRDGLPVKAGKGIQIGKWRTAVKGVFVHTLGLGGDSAVRIRRKTGELYLDHRRVVPLCSLAVRYPRVTERLQAILTNTDRHIMMLHEFILGLKDIEDDPRYTQQERTLSARLKEGPLSLQEAADAVGTDLYNMNFERLERENIIIRCGLTPTDIMHLKGDFHQFCEPAARMGAGFLANCKDMTVESLCDWVYREVRRKLYLNIAEILIKEEMSELAQEDLAPQMQAFLEHSFEMAESDADRQIRFRFSTPSVLIGAGAPIHVFLPEVARMFGTECVIPPHSEVINAAGAVAGNITVSRTVTIKHDDGKYIVPTPEGAFVTKEYEEAVSLARSLAKDTAVEAVMQRGASGAPLCKFEVKDHTATLSYGGDIFLGSDVTATAIGVLKL